MYSITHYLSTFLAIGYKNVIYILILKNDIFSNRIVNYVFMNNT